MHVHYLHPPDPQPLDYLKSLLDRDINISSGEIQSEHHLASVLVAGRPTHEELQMFKDLEILIVPWTGIPTETLEAVKEIPGLRLHNLHHNAAPVAELALALLFAVGKKIIPFDTELREGNWQLRYKESDSLLLAGKRALIVGYGQIGKRIGSALLALDVQVDAIKRSAGDEDASNVHSSDRLMDLLPETDFLFLALPLTEDTEHLIADTELKSLPNTAILVNVSRGNVVKQDALYSALKEREIYGAGLDVWYNYPADKESRSNTPPGDYPFHELDNIVFSPHRAGLVRETETLRMKALAGLLNASAKGKRITNEVNIDLGY